MPVMDGKLYSASDPLTWQEEVWAEEIIRCLTNPEKLSEYKAKAISRAKVFDAEKITKKYFKVVLGKQELEARSKKPKVRPLFI